MKKTLLLLAAIALFTSCSDEKKLRGEVTYLVQSDKPGMNVTFLYDSGKSQTSTLASDALTTFFRAQSEDLLYINAQSTNPDACMQAFILFKGDTVNQSKACGDYITVNCIYEIPFDELD